MGPAALCLRMLHTLFTLKGDGPPQWHLRAAFLLFAWLAACAFQVVLGFSLKWLAYLYVQHHAAVAGGKSLPRAINVTPAGVKLVPGTAAAVAAKPSIGLPAAQVPAAAGAAAGASAAAAGAGAGAGISSISVGTGAKTCRAAGAASTTGPSAAAAAAGPGCLQRSSANAVCGVSVKHASRSDEGSSKGSSSRADACVLLGRSAPGSHAADAAACAMQEGLAVAAAAGAGAGPVTSSSSSSSTCRGNGEGAYVDSNSSNSAGSSVLLPEHPAGRAAHFAGAPVDGLALGFGGGYTAASAAGLSHRAYSKSQSCADMGARSSMQPALAVAQE